MSSVLTFIVLRSIFVLAFESFVIFVKFINIHFDCYSPIAVATAAVAAATAAAAVVLPIQSQKNFAHKI